MFGRGLPGPPQTPEVNADEAMAVAEMGFDEEGWGRHGLTSDFRLPRSPPTGRRVDAGGAEKPLGESLPALDVSVASRPGKPRPILSANLKSFHRSKR